MATRVSSGRGPAASRRSVLLGGASIFLAGIRASPVSAAGPSLTAAALRQALATKDAATLWAMIEPEVDTAHATISTGGEHLAHWGWLGKRLAQAKLKALVALRDGGYGTFGMRDVFSWSSPEITGMSVWPAASLEANWQLQAILPDVPAFDHKLVYLGQEQPRITQDQIAYAALDALRVARTAFPWVADETSSIFLRPLESVPLDPSRIERAILALARRKGMEIPLDIASFTRSALSAEERLAVPSPTQSLQIAANLHDGLERELQGLIRTRPSNEPEMAALDQPERDIVGGPHSES